MLTPLDLLRNGSVQVYTWVSPEGRNIHIDSDALRRTVLGCLDIIPVSHIAIDHETARGYVTDNVVSMARVDELRKRDWSEPGIFCTFDAPSPGWPDGLHVDGHHRYVLAALSGHKAVRAYIINEAAWRAFQVEGLKTLTQDQLHDIPINPRPY